MRPQEGNASLAGCFIGMRVSLMRSVIPIRFLLRRRIPPLACLLPASCFRVVARAQVNLPAGRDLVERETKQERKEGA